MSHGKQLTEHFHSSEFDCKDGTPVPDKYYPALTKLCEVFLEPMRKKFGPGFIHSGFRTTEHNRRVGGARASFHVYTDRPRRDGVAADVSFRKGSVNQWRDEAQRLRANRKDGKGNGGIGFYIQGGFIHVDTRDYPADWNGS